MTLVSSSTRVAAITRGDRPVSDVLHRWLGPRPRSVAAPSACTGACGHCGTCGTCGRRLGTGNDPSVARALRELQDAAPGNDEAYERNLRSLHQVAEADLVIAAARTLGYRGTLTHHRAGTFVYLHALSGIGAGTVAIRHSADSADPTHRATPYTWRLSARVPDELAGEIARLAPAWVAVEQDSRGGALLRRAAQRSAPPRQWTRRLPPLRRPSLGGGEA